MLEVGNKLRNAIAHGKEESSIASKMAAFRKAYVDTLTPEEAKASEKLTDDQIVVVAFGMVGGYLVVAAERVKEEREKKKA